MDFRRGQVTPVSTWRAIILYGANAATYKFAFGRALLDEAATGADVVSLDALAPRYASYLVEALAREPRQGTARQSRFLDALRAQPPGSPLTEAALAATIRHGFANVVDAFPQLGGALAPIQFYEDHRRDPGVRGLVLSPALRDLATADQTYLLSDETEARWRLVETAWAVGLNTGLIATIEHTHGEEDLFITRTERRRSVAGVVPSLSGYQDGRCAYCQVEMTEQGGGSPVVEHVLPFALQRTVWTGPPLDAVWNLVLACAQCNSRKGARAPDERWMPWLATRNDDLIASHHPLRQTLMAQTGMTEDSRLQALRAAYALATERLPRVWTPPNSVAGGA